MAVVAFDRSGIHQPRGGWRVIAMVEPSSTLTASSHVSLDFFDADSVSARCCSADAVNADWLMQGD